LDCTSGVEAWGGGRGSRRRVGRRCRSSRSGCARIEGNHDRETDAAYPKHEADAKPSAAEPLGAQHRSEEADPSTLAAIFPCVSVAAIVRRVLVAAIAIIYRRRNCFGRLARLVVGCVFQNRLGPVDLAAPFA
jgi:hypothetical protein